MKPSKMIYCIHAKYRQVMFCALHFLRVQRVRSRRLHGTR